MTPEEEEAFPVNMQRLRDDIGYCLQEAVCPYCGNNETFSKQFSEMERQKQYYCPKCGFGVDVQSLIDWRAGQSKVVPSQGRGSAALQ